LSLELFDQIIKVKKRYC